MLASSLLAGQKSLHSKAGHLLAVRRIYSPFNCLRSLLSSSTKQYERYITRKSENLHVYDFRDDQTTKSPIFVTAEHASNSLPLGIDWGAIDKQRGTSETHWAYDPGTAELSLELAKELNTCAGLSLYSRLFVDLNRPLASTTLMREECEIGETLELNLNLTEEQKLERIGKYYVPFYRDLGIAAAEVDPQLILSIHSFTKLYQGKPRDVEVGILYSTSSLLALAIHQDLLEDGYKKCELNQPWSGLDGFLYSADSLAFATSVTKSRRSLMLEIRNDLLTDVSWRTSFAASFLKSLRSNMALIEL